MTMQLIQHQELGSSQTSITFSSIPQTFTDLYLVFSLRSNNGSGDNEIFLNINGSAGTDTVLYSFGSSGNGSNSSGTQMRLVAAGGTSTANTFGTGHLYIPNYTSSVSKAVQVESASETNATTNIGFYVTAGLPTNTSPVTSIALNCVGNSWVQFSSATLYGILRGSDGITTVS